MKSIASVSFLVALLASCAAAQFVSPVPVVEAEIRDNSSVRMRSITLDRFKREARKKTSEQLGPAAVNNFLEIKEDFEKIQMLESDIVRVYTTGKQIEYSKIAGFSAAINQSAARLKTNFLAAQKADRKKSPERPNAPEKALPNGVEPLIIELDNAIGAFVGNRIFLDPPKSKLRDREQAEVDLDRIIRLSAALREAAERQIQAKN
jgi:hypothetical protein